MMKAEFSKAEFDELVEDYINAKEDLKQSWEGVRKARERIAELKEKLKEKLGTEDIPPAWIFKVYLKLKKHFGDRSFTLAEISEVMKDDLKKNSIFVVIRKLYDYKLIEWHKEDKDRRYSSYRLVNFQEDGMN